MSVKSDQALEAAHAIEALRRIVDRETVLHTRTQYMRGQTDYVSVYVIRTGDAVYAGPWIEDVSYFVARLTGRRMTDRGIAVGGGQFNKGLDVADHAWRVLFGANLPQGSNWRELI